MVNELDLVTLEAIILLAEKPDYIEVSYTMGWIYVLVAKRDYKHFKIQERYKMIYDLIKTEVPYIINKAPILIETLDTHDLGDLFRLYGKKEI